MGLGNIFSVMQNLHVNQYSFVYVAYWRMFPEYSTVRCTKPCFSPSTIKTLMSS